MPIAAPAAFPAEANVSNKSNSEPVVTAYQLTPLRPNTRIQALITRPTSIIIPISKHPGPRTIIPNRKMIPLPLRAWPTKIPLKRHRRPLNLIVNSLSLRLATPQEQIVEERRDGVVGDVGGGELLAGVLAAAVGDAKVAVGAGEGGGVGLRVDPHGEGEGDAAVAVVLVVVGWVAEVAWGWGGEDEVRRGGGGGAGCCCGGSGGGSGRGGYSWGRGGVAATEKCQLGMWKAEGRQFRSFRECTHVVVEVVRVVVVVRATKELEDEGRELEAAVLDEGVLLDTAAADDGVEEAIILDDLDWLTIIMELELLMLILIEVEASSSSSSSSVSSSGSSGSIYSINTAESRPESVDHMSTEALR